MYLSHTCSRKAFGIFCLTYLVTAFMIHKALDFLRYFLDRFVAVKSNFVGFFFSRIFTHTHDYLK
jgi:hypothetical protein